MAHMPIAIKSFLQQLPVRWDDVKYIDGFPGKYVIIARKAGKKWYIAGINGESIPRTIQLDLTPFKAGKALLITDGKEQSDFNITTSRIVSPQTITLQPAGGFVIVLE
jgi:hypothetical protein